METREALRRFGALRELRPALLDAIAAAFVEAGTHDGDVLIRAGSRRGSAHLVLAGAIAVESADGHPLARLEAGSLFGHMALLDGAPASATCRAIGGGRVGRLGPAAFALLTCGSAEIAYAFQRAVAEQTCADYRRQLALAVAPKGDASVARPLPVLFSAG